MRAAALRWLDANHESMTPAQQQALLQDLLHAGPGQVIEMPKNVMPLWMDPPAARAPRCAYCGLREIGDRARCEGCGAPL